MSACPALLGLDSAFRLLPVGWFPWSSQLLVFPRMEQL